MNSPIRVLHVVGSMNRGGTENMIMNLYRSIDRTKVQFDFVENDGSEAAFDKEIEDLGGRIFRCPRYNALNHFFYVKWWKVFFEKNKGEYSVVHGHIGSTAAMYLKIAKQYGLYTIAHSHSAGKGSLAYRVFSYPTRNIANYFFACSKKAAIVRYGNKIGLDESKCEVLNNAIDTALFSYNEEIRLKKRSELGLSDSNFVIGHVGRFSKEKNHVFLIDIFKKIHELNNEAKLLLVGDGHLIDDIKNYAKEKGLDNDVIYAGSQAVVSDYYQAMDAFVFPSIYEGLGVAVIEAQASGLPCYVSDSVPNEVAITDLVVFCSLSSNAETWSNIILSNKKTYCREDMNVHIKNAGYDVRETSEYLMQFYYKNVVNK